MPNRAYNQEFCLGLEVRPTLFVLGASGCGALQRPVSFFEWRHRWVQRQVDLHRYRRINQEARRVLDERLLRWIHRAKQETRTDEELAV